MIRVTLFCTFRESENTRTCENCTRYVQKRATKSDTSSHCLVCSDSNRTAQRLQMAACKSFETTSGMILNRSQSKFEGYCSPIGRKWNATCRVTAPGKGNCSDSNRTAQQWQTAQRLHMAARKSLETMSGMILNRSQPKFPAKSVANEMQCLNATSFNFWFEDF